jgi:thioesterase domain-containing protein/acyl carrier protein
LGEIEAALAAQPGVRQAVVAAREDTPGDQRLVAYLVPDGPDAPDAAELRAGLRTGLPEFMIPSAFVPLASLPLTPNGKVDRKALPAPQDVTETPADGAAAPRDTLEVQLLALWEGVLGVRSVGIDDNFFDLGGHSLLAARLFVEIDRVFGRTLPLATLFKAPTVAALAAELRRPGHEPDWSPLVLLAAGGDRPPLFVVHAIGGNVLGYRAMARHLGGERPVYGLQALGLDGQQLPQTRVEEMAARYLVEVRRVQPHGPYHLGGQCFGGMLALEMAQQLRAQGEEIALLAMFDSDAPGYEKALPLGGRAMVAARWFTRRTRFHAHQLAELPASARLPYLAARGETVGRRGRSRILGLAGRAYEHVGQPLPEALHNVREAGLLAQRDYKPQLYHGRPVLFVVNNPEEPVAPGSQYGWEGLTTGGVEIIEVPGDHETMLDEPHASVLATRLRDCLSRAERAA